MSMSFEVEGQTLRILGELDRFTLGAPQNYQYPNMTGDITVDLKKVNNTDTAGLAWLLRLVSTYEQKGHQLTITNQPEQLIALASISNVLNLLPLSHS